jgi:hypothetical protein
MKYAAEMGSGATIYKPNFIQTGSKVDKGDTQTHRMMIAKAYFYFFKTKEVG